jgi:hypothetical protein
LTQLFLKVEKLKMNESIKQALYLLKSRHYQYKPMVYNPLRSFVFVAVVPHGNACTVATTFWNGVDFVLLMVVELCSLVLFKEHEKTIRAFPEFHDSCIVYAVDGTDQTAFHRFRTYLSLNIDSKITISANVYFLSPDNKFRLFKMLQQRLVDDQFHYMNCFVEGGNIKRSLFAQLESIKEYKSIDGKDRICLPEGPHHHLHLAIFLALDLAERFMDDNNNK